MWNANFMQQGNFINIFLARHVSGTYAYHQEHQMLSCSIWFSAPSFWMGGGLESRCVGRVYGADGAVRDTIRTVHTVSFPVFFVLFSGITVKAAEASSLDNENTKILCLSLICNRFMSCISTEIKKYRSKLECC